jgi:citrate synthase
MKWLTIDSACAMLGIKPASLYSYVSRGMVRARTSENDPRASLYASADIDHLLKRKRAGRTRDSIARGAIGWGEPILESAISTVKDGRLIFRGLDAVTLSDTHTLEAVASILWGGGGMAKASQCTDPILTESPKEAGLLYLAKRVSADGSPLDRSRADVSSEAGRLLEGLSHAMALGSPGITTHEKLAGLWRLNRTQGDILRRALVLLADHELNPSTFAARIAASTGGSLAACALAGFTTLTGPYHGEAASRAMDFLTHAHVVGPDRAVTRFKAHWQVLPGIGHKLYPDGDPRAQALLTALRPYPLIEEAIAQAQTGWGGLANIDMALAALTLAMGLPRSAPFTLFALARMAGWLAHGSEQGLSGALIRPRARYIGNSTPF